ncbi:MAG: HD domain-containing protein [Bdellovibrionaceae bacterium]|jgi:HD-GYP domain-containing protein (c-di-GMP phosphodiesterase class II)|nr:HD domain-containing protein [Pseudobdellovibrionaceae bacterium]
MSDLLEIFNILANVYKLIYRLKNMDPKKIKSSNDEFFVPLPIEDFLTGMKAAVDLYVRLSDEKFVLVFKNGLKTEQSQLAAYKEKSIRYLWAKESEYAKMTEHSVVVAGIAVNSDQTTTPQKAKFVSQAATHIFNEFEHIGLTHEVFEQAKLVTNVTVTLVQNHNDLLGLLESMKGSSSELVRHSMAVSALSVVLGMGLGWKNKNTIEKLSLGGLMHDIGLKALPPELICKPKIQMTSEELTIYESHPFKGMEMVMSLGVVPDDIVSIIYEHHENAIGQGFPRRLRNLKMHPLAKVVACADTFVHLVLANVNCPIPKSPREAILYMEHTMGQPFDKEVFKVLRNITSDFPMDLAS